MEQPIIKWSGVTTAYYSDAEPKKGFRQIWVLDAQWSTCPVEVEEEVIKIWKTREYGNDYFIHETTIAQLLKSKYFAIVQYVREVNPSIPDDEVFFIHWWW
jgi:hypothetical protein